MITTGSLNVAGEFNIVPNLAKTSTTGIPILIRRFCLCPAHCLEQCAPLQGLGHVFNSIWLEAAKGRNL